MVELREIVEKVAIEAGNELIDYFRSRNFSTQKKEDGSPITSGDLASNEIILRGLQACGNIPVLSEESLIEFEQRKSWRKFWLVDPLDGTKDFLSGSEEFVISIALIDDNRPILGLIYAPLLQEIYCAEKHKGVSIKIRGVKCEPKVSANITAATSRFHQSSSTEQFLKKNQIRHSVRIGSALKFGRIALGEIDLYPRFEGSKEWDTAAGHLIVTESGGQMIDLRTREEPIYNKKDLRNNYFIACSKRLTVCDFEMPEGVL